ncbi:MAG: ABC transporter permease subunit [Ferrimonas sp.]
MNSATPSLLYSHRRRLFKDKFARWSIVVGGNLVLVALLSVFFYLLAVVFPVAQSTKLTPSFSAPKLSLASTVALGVNELQQLGYRLTQDGVVEFYAADGLHFSQQIAIPAGQSIASIAVVEPNGSQFALGLSGGGVLFVSLEFVREHRQTTTSMIPQLSYPFGEQPWPLADDAIKQLVASANDTEMSLLWRSETSPWQWSQWLNVYNFLLDESHWQVQPAVTTALPLDLQQLLLTPDQQQLFSLSGAANQVDVWQRQNNQWHYRQTLALENAPVTAMTLLAGASSLLLAQGELGVTQWFESRTEDGRQYRLVRDFDDAQSAQKLAVESARRTFAVADWQGNVSFWHSTSEQQLLQQRLSQPLLNMAFSPAGNGFIVEFKEHVQLFELRNEHPEISFSALWQRVWYEGYSEPDYVWQSSSAAEEFEAKFSVLPLVFGTVKAALYAMLFAVPIAIGAAIYTAYFMTPQLRAWVKPAIEIMEAFPTVILGFLAGMWLAPLVEANLVGVLLLLLLLPLAILLLSWSWLQLPAAVRQWRLLQYRELALIPLLAAVVWACMALSPLLEVWFFNGDGRAFITETLGISFDQRNALVVGIAMGIAVIPTIFTIAEDAIYSVPRHLIDGSLALGATAWQTLTRVVLFTASPGIFSAIMMGFGRTVGETMIVLMATGNTPLMNMNLFEGMRTLAANLAIEMPEAAIHSSHYRVLFLTALVLFVFTFIFNTVAELVRQRLRRNYSTL